MMTTPRLPFSHYSLRFRALEPVSLPRYSGSAWRGAFGHTLRRSVCVTGERDCAYCLLYRSCIYPYIFETPPPPDAAKMRLYTAAPHPYVLRPEALSLPLAAGEDTELGVVLIGRAVSQLPYVIHALSTAAGGGIGYGRGRLTLVEARQESPVGSGHWERIYVPGGELAASFAALPELPAPGDAIRVRLLTPLRLRHENAYVSPERFGFADLFSSLLRRVSMLSYFHGDQPLQTDFAALAHAARQVQLKSRQLEWREWARYSTRQDTRLQMGGLLGEIHLGEVDLTPFWPYLWLGQWLHAGKGTAMGLGRYEVLPS